MWPFGRRRDLLAKQREELAREHARSAARGHEAETADAHEAMWRLAQEQPDLLRTMASQHPTTGRMRGWSVTGSTTGDNRIVFRKERQEPGDTEPQVATFAGTPLELCGQLARHILRSMIPRRGNGRVTRHALPDRRS